MYCPRSKMFGDSQHQMKDGPMDDKCIPEDYKNAYASFNLVYISFMANHVVRIVKQKRLGHPFKLQDVHKAAYMSAHFIGCNVIEKDIQHNNRTERVEDITLKKQTEDNMSCLNMSCLNICVNNNK